jgi:predicted short-subunit dehydrogenase-like oxidoreductase (DUF2520 family)
LISSIVLIGSGNVATHLGSALKKAGCKILQVYSPNKAHAASLAQKLKTKSCNVIEEINPNADLYLMAIKDDAIIELSQKLKVRNKIIVHTSGSSSMNMLNNISKNTGVFYPLQTFSKDRKINLQYVPFCIEANNKSTEKQLLQLAQLLSNNVCLIDSHQRKILHIAAVFACNFSNYLFSISEKILNDHHISFDILKPLIYETIYKIENTSPKAMQTGPAKRKDKKTIQAHLDFLKNYPDYKKLYKLLSESIMISG